MRQPWRMRRRKQLHATKPCTPDGCGCWLKVIPNDSVRNLSWQAVGLRAPSVLWNFVFERRRFRQFLSSLAEWCAAYWVKGRRWAAAVKFPATTVPPPPPIFSPLVSHGGTHHSAANAVNERNPLRETTKTRQRNLSTPFPRTPNGVRIPPCSPHSTKPCTPTGVFSL